MNFLAHAYLSGTDKKILIGNFTGDFIKGRQALSEYPPDIIRGVELHRAIDEFTDAHPVVHKSKDRLRPGYRHYAGVIVDVFHDHFLAANWSQYHPATLESFVDNVYQTLDTHADALPESFQPLLPYMMNGNWLVSYRTVAGVHRALSGMASRTPYPSRMEHAAKDLEKYYPDFEAEFQEFFPELQKFAQAWLEP